MKIKAKLNKIKNLNAQAIPCDKATRKALIKGNIVDVTENVASELLAMNIVESVTTKKAKKKEAK